MLKDINNIELKINEKIWVNGIIATLLNYKKEEDDYILNVKYNNGRIQEIYIMEDVRAVKELYNLNDLTYKDKIGLIKKLSYFKLIKEKNIYKIKDIKNYNTENIEREDFLTIDEVLERLENYFIDEGIIILS